MQERKKRVSEEGRNDWFDRYGGKDPVKYDKSDSY